MRWEDFRDKHRDETCLIIGNGPSLNDIPLEFLRSYPSFGTNRIYLLANFTPTYYVATNPLVLTQYLPDIKAVQCIKFVRNMFAPVIPESLGFHLRGGRGFSKDGVHLHEGYTVTYVALQLAYFMGFSRVLLVGLDHTYLYQGGPNEQKVMGKRDPNHFSPDYFAHAVWNNPDLAESEKSYELARLAYKDAGRDIINCSTKSMLAIFPRRDWRDYAKNG